MENLVLCIDGDAIIRFGGRLVNFKLSLNAKNPIILPKVHNTTNLIIDYYHDMYLHAAIELLQSIIVKLFGYHPAALQLAIAIAAIHIMKHP